MEAVMEYREITPDDVPKLAKIYMDTFNAEPWFDKWTEKTAGKRLAQLLSHEGSDGLVSVENEAITGMILGEEEQYFDGVIFTIKEFCVKNNLRGKGIGKALLAEFENRLRAKGIRSVLLFTAPEDKAFYQKRGYAETELLALEKEL